MVVIMAVSVMTVAVVVTVVVAVLVVLKNGCGGGGVMTVVVAVTFTRILRRQCAENSILYDLRNEIVPMKADVPMFI